MYYIKIILIGYPYNIIFLDYAVSLVTPWRKFRSFFWVFVTNILFSRACGHFRGRETALLLAVSSQRARPGNWYVFSEAMAARSASRTKPTRSYG